MKAMGTGWWDCGEGWCRTEMGEEGLPQGVVGSRVATWEKPGRCCRPVPPMTAMGIGSWVGMLANAGDCLVEEIETYHRSEKGCWPFCGSQCEYSG